MMRKYPVRFGGRGRCVLSRGASPRPNRDLKATGLYVARALSFAGVEYEILRHELTPAQIAIYDTYADAWGHPPEHGSSTRAHRRRRRSGRRDAE